MDTVGAVKIPAEKGVHTKKAGRRSELYVYKNTRYYRTETGQSRHDCVCIGKVCPDDTTMMIPNERYFSTFNIPIPSTLQKSNPTSANSNKGGHVENTTAMGSDIFSSAVNSVWHYGFIYVVFKIAADIGLLNILKTCLGEEGALDIIALCAYIIEEGNSMDGMIPWQEITFLPYDAQPFEPPRISMIFQSLTYKLRSSIIKKWVAINNADDCICYDVTSISSYSRNNIEVEFGYNRDHEKLRQLNMGYFSSLSTRRPLAYAVYNGSLNDSSNLGCVTENAFELGLKNFHLFADGGFFFEKCFIPLKKYMKSFTIGMPLERKISKAYVDSVSSDIMDFNHRIMGRHIQCVEIEGAVYRTKGRILVFFDQGRADDENSDMDDTIFRFADELREMKKPPRAKKYRNYFKITEHKDDNGFDYEVDIDKINSMMKYHGYFLIFTTNKTFSPEEILEHYREKDVDEKMFFQIKNPMHGKRTRAHSADTTDGKLFVTFFATVLRSEMHRLIKSYLRKHSLSMKTVISKLSNILLASGASGYRLVKEITKEQREILTELGAFDGLRKSIEDLNIAKK